MKLSALLYALVSLAGSFLLAQGNPKSAVPNSSLIYTDPGDGGGWGGGGGVPAPSLTVGTIVKEHYTTAEGGNLNGALDNALQFGQATRDGGWNWIWHAPDGSIYDWLFVGVYSTLASGVDMGFYTGHGRPQGPFLDWGPSASTLVPTNYFWSSTASYNGGSSHGLRWMVTQSCEWLKDGYSGVNNNWSPYPGDNYSLNRWQQAMGNAQGSMHAIFGYMSLGYIMDRGYTWQGGLFGSWSKWAPTDLAPVSFAKSTVEYGYQSGPSWFNGSETQKYYANNYGLHDPGEVPAVITVSNQQGDYYYEPLRYPWPDPININDPNGTIVIHYQIIGTPEYSAN